jgi:hypothetical protein
MPAFPRRTAMAMALIAAVVALGFALPTTAQAAQDVPAQMVGSPSGTAWTVPEGVHSVDVVVAGGAGGGGGPVRIPIIGVTITSDGAGSAGGLLDATIPVTPGDTLVFYTGTAGGPTGSRHAPGGGGAGWASGGAGNTGSLAGDAGGGGGGASAVTLRTGDGEQPLVVAGGGGAGGGLGGAFADCNGGDGGSGQGSGAPEGGSSGNGICAGGGGGGGAAVAGGSAGTSGSGAGSSSSGGGGGGGGGGYVGGSGGAGSHAGGAGGGGGGGGSSWVSGAADVVTTGTGYNGADGFVQLTYSIATQTALTVTSTVNPSIFGTPADLSVTVASTENTDVPIGTVTASEGGTILATASLDSVGVAAFPALLTAVGDHTVDFLYTPTAQSIFGSTSGSYLQTVDKSPSHISDLTMTGTGVVGQDVTVTGSVLAGLDTSSAPMNPLSLGTPELTGASPTPNAPTAPTAPASTGPSGSVTVSDGTGTPATLPLDTDGGFTYDVPWSVGTASLVFSYAGDSDYSAAQDTSTKVEDQPGVTKTTVSLDRSSTAVGQDVTATMSLQPVTRAVIAPTGMLQLTVDGKPYGTPFDVAASRSSTVVISGLSAGSHTVTAVYSGDSSFQTSTSSVATVTLTSAGLAFTGSATNVLGAVDLIGLLIAAAVIFRQFDRRRKAPKLL